MTSEEAMPAHKCASGSAKLRRLAIGALWLLCGAPGYAQTSIATTTYGYDEIGNKTSQFDALGRKTAWTFDAKDRVIGRTLPDGTKETYTYDAIDNVLAKTTFAGETFSFQYDANNYLTGQVIPAGTSTNSAIGGASVVTTYTATGNVATRQEQGSTTLGGLQSFKYNASDRLIETKNPIGQISYSLNPLGVVERSIPGAGTVKYELDAVGRLAKVVAADGKAALYSYDQIGRLIGIDRELNSIGGQPQVLLTSIRYDDADRAVAIAEVKRLGASLTFIAGQTLTRGPGGAISMIETHRGDGTSRTDGQVTARVDAIQSFEYDGVARLTRELRSHAGGTVDTRYEYDAIGNRTKKTVIKAIGMEITTYTYDAADRLTLESISLMTGGSRVVSYTYDGNGNLASKAEPGSVTLYRFDPRNKLIDIRVGDSQAEAQAAAPRVRYAYDADGNRVRKWLGEERGYLVDVNTLFPQVVLEATPTGTVEFVRGLDLIRQISRTSTATEDLFPLHGHLGTSLGALNADGDLIEQVGADAFGNLDQPSGLKQAHLYAGEYWDQDAQLLYLRARWYDPRIGRFISADPVEGKTQDPQSLNRYAYAHSDPVHRVDPRGEMSFGEAMSAVSNIGVSVAVRVTVLASQYPRLTGVAGFLASIFLPMELGPGSNLTASLGQASALAMQSGARQLTQTAREFAKNGNFIGQGGVFEDAVASILRISKNTRPVQVKVDGRVITVVPDYYWGAKILEIKTSGGAINLDQAVGLAALAKERGQELVYVFYRRPSIEETARLFRRIESELGIEAAERVTINYLFH